MMEYDTLHLYSTLCRGSSPKANLELRTCEHQNNKKHYFEGTTYEQIRLDAISGTLSILLSLKL